MHGALHPGAQVLLWDAELLGCFPSLPSRETWLLSQDTREQKLPRLRTLPQAPQQVGLKERS